MNLLNLVVGLFKRPLDVDDDDDVSPVNVHRRRVVVEAAAHVSQPQGQAVHRRAAGQDKNFGFRGSNPGTESNLLDAADNQICHPSDHQTGSKILVL